MSGKRWAASGWGGCCLCTHIPRTTLPPMSPSHYVCPHVVWPTLHFFCAEDLGGGQALGSGAAGAGPQPSRSLLCREGGDRIKLQLSWWITWPPRKSCNQSPVFLRDVPGAEKGPTRVCLQRQGVGLLGFSNVHHPAPLLLAFRSSPRATAWLGLWTFFPMDPEWHWVLP